MLDTGYDPVTVFFRTPDRKRRIQGWKDTIVDESTNCQDEDGHGTYVLSLLMKVAPAADFYIARVARNTNDLENSTENVAQVCPTSQGSIPPHLILSTDLITRP